MSTGNCIIGGLAAPDWARLRTRENAIFFERGADDGVIEAGKHVAGIAGRANLHVERHFAEEGAPNSSAFARAPPLYRGEWEMAGGGTANIQVRFLDD